jgi:hypothetical protein
MTNEELWDRVRRNAITTVELCKRYEELEFEIERLGLAIIRSRRPEDLQPPKQCA